MQSIEIFALVHSLSKMPELEAVSLHRPTGSPKSQLICSGTSYFFEHPSHPWPRNAYGPRICRATRLTSERGTRRCSGTQDRRKGPHQKEVRYVLNRRGQRHSFCFVSRTTSWRECIVHHATLGRRVSSTELAQRRSAAGTVVNERSCAATILLGRR